MDKICCSYTRCLFANIFQDTKSLKLILMSFSICIPCVFWTWLFFILFLAIFKWFLQSLPPFCHSFFHSFCIVFLPSFSLSLSFSPRISPFLFSSPLSYLHFSLPPSIYSRPSLHTRHLSLPLSFHASFPFLLLLPIPPFLHSSVILEHQDFNHVMTCTLTFCNKFNLFQNISQMRLFRRKFTKKVKKDLYIIVSETIKI